MLKYKIEDYIGKKYGHLKVLGKAIESNVPNCFCFYVTAEEKSLSLLT